MTGYRLARLPLALLFLLAWCVESGAQPYEQPGPNVPSDVQGLSPAIAVAFGTNKWADYNGDGNWDFVLLGRLPFTSPNTVPLFGDVFRGSPTISLNPPGLAYAFFILRSIESVWLSDADWDDFDRDGDLDLITMGASAIADPLQPRTTLYESNGNLITPTGTALPGLYSGRVRWGDLDNDGDPDLAMIGLDADGEHTTAVFRNEGAGSFAGVATSIPGLAHGTVEWLDFDGDGDQDLFAAGVESDGALYAGLHRNDGGTLVDSGEQFRGLAFARVAVADFDSDADLDIVISGKRHSVKYGSGETTLYRNDGGRFVESVGITNAYYGDIKWTDHDRDGDLDILVAGRRETFGGNLLQACVQNAPSTFACQQLQTAGLGGQPAPGVGYGSLQVVDYNVDNIPDVMATGMLANSQHFTTLYKSVSTAANTPPLAPGGLSSVPGPGTVTLSWDAALDANTASSGLTYELRVGTSPGGIDVVAPRANPQTGFRRVVDIGRAGSARAWFLTGLAPGTYYWSVQAVDNSFAGSPFAAEQTFTISG